jgi:phosphoglucosamine mutase
MLHNGSDNYIRHLRTFFNPLFLQGRKIVLDCANGATFELAPRIFTEFGATIIALHNKPNGTNINAHCGTLHPNDVQKAVMEHHADIGFAFDGDGDRVVAINHRGEIKNGDDILALLLDHPLYTTTSTVVGTIMSNHGLATFLSLRDIALERTPVGDRYIADYLVKNSLLIGGEQSGHIILRDYLDMGDGIFTALRILEVLIAHNNWEMSSFEKYPQLLINLPVAIKKELTSPSIAAIIAMGNNHLHQGRLVVRYSGTENVLRIMIEDSELTHAQHIGTVVSQALQKELATP